MSNNGNKFDELDYVRIKADENAPFMIKPYDGEIGWIEMFALGNEEQKYIYYVMFWMEMSPAEATNVVLQVPEKYLELYKSYDDLTECEEYGLGDRVRVIVSKDDMPCYKGLVMDIAKFNSKAGKVVSAYGGEYTVEFADGTLAFIYGANLELISRAPKSNSKKSDKVSITKKNNPMTKEGFLALKIELENALGRKDYKRVKRIAKEYNFYKSILPRDITDYVDKQTKMRLCNKKTGKYGVGKYRQIEFMI